MENDTPDATGPVNILANGVGEPEPQSGDIAGFPPAAAVGVAGVNGFVPGRGQPFPARGGFNGSRGGSGPMRGGFGGAPVMPHLATAGNRESQTVVCVCARSRRR